MINTSLEVGTKEVANMMEEKGMKDLKSLVASSNNENQPYSSTSSRLTSDIPDAEHHDQVHQVTVGNNDTLHFHSSSTPRSSFDTNEEFQQGSRDTKKRKNTLNDFMNAILNHILGLPPSVIIVPIIIIYCFINPSGNVINGDYILFDFETIVKIELVAFLVYQFGTKNGTVTFNWSNTKERIISMDLLETMHYIGMMRGFLQLTLWLREVFAIPNDVSFESNTSLRT